MRESFDHSKAVKLITKLSERINAQFKNPGTTELSSEPMTVLADLRDYYLYEVLDATRERAPGLINLLWRLETQSDQQGDRFHAGFFFTLAELLKVKYEIGGWGEKIKRQDFERSFAVTRVKLGLGEVRQSSANEELIRKARLSGYVVRGMSYPSPLPPELQEAYCYTSDGGHSIIVVLENEYHDGQRVEDNLVPAPVKTVLRRGYKIKDGYVWCNIPYSEELGLLTEEDDDEF